MNRNLFTSPIFKILFLFFSWRIFLLFILFFSIRYLPLGNYDRFLGGGSINYSLSPELFSWANFDGEHYLAISMYGYKALEQAFFPVYPVLISFFSRPFSSDLISLLVNSTLVGLFISNISFLLALILLFDLLRIDYSKKISLMTIILLLSFPTSFYFGSVYNESLFLLLSLGSFYFAKKRNWFFASIFGGIASATRVFGFLLFPAFVIEAYQQKEKLSKVLWLGFIPLGLIFYMIYQYQTVGDPLAFYNLQKQVGEQHQSGVILLPQVFFRYTKMLVSVNMSQQIYQTLVLEFITGVLFFALPIYGYFKKGERIKLSYFVYALSGFLLPTIQGSFSSLPRYCLILFPSFIVLAIIFDKLSKFINALLILMLLFLLAFECALFLRGYWVA